MPRKLWNKDYILALQGNAVSTIGDLMYSVAIGYWVYSQTGSSALMGIMSSISMFVSMFLSPFCGSIVDKCNRKWVIVLIDIVQGLLMLGMGVMAYTNTLNIPAVLIVAFIAAFGSVFYSPALSTIMLDIIPRDDLVRGQSLHSSIGATIQLVGTAFSGAMVAIFGVPLIVVINGLSNLYAAVSEMFITIPKTAQEGEAVTVKGVLQDFKTALTDVFAEPCLRILMPSVVILNFLGAGPMTLMLALPEKNRGAIIGLVNAACTGGCALSAVVYGLLGDVFPLYLVFAAGGAISLIPMIYVCFHKEIKAFVSTH